MLVHLLLQPFSYSFKAIVFATWWQGVGIALLCALGVLPSEGKLQTGLQDFFICIEMAVAAVAHVFVFSAKPYHFLPAPDCGKITTQSTQTTKESLRLEEGDKLEKLAVLGRTDTEAEAAGTSVKESIQDIVVEGGQHVVKDVVLTINQAIEPVGKGVSKIQESFHQRTSVAPNANKDEHVQVEERVEQILNREGSHLFSSEETLIN